MKLLPKHIKVSGEKSLRSKLQAFAESGADLVSAATVNYVEEGAGIALAAKRLDIPAVIRFTLETKRVASRWDWAWQGRQEG